jgi:predicted cupin superfamily sugar epimerase
MTADEVIAALGLAPHPEEGGWFVETWRDGAAIDAAAPAGGTRSRHTAIYFLLTPKTVSAMHLLPGDEVFHHYAGGAVEMLLLHPDGRTEVRWLGDDLAAGHRPQIVVPGGVWQGGVLAEGAAWCLLGCTMAPGFAYEDYIHGDIPELAARYPDAADAIRARTYRRAEG